MPINEKMNCGESVVAVLKNAATGEKRVIDDVQFGTPSAKYKFEVKVTNLRTGEVHKYEVER